MGQVGEQAGVWAYVEGGMGAVSDAIAASAVEAGVEISTNPVSHCRDITAYTIPSSSAHMNVAKRRERERWHR